MMSLSCRCSTECKNNHISHVADRALALRPIPDGHSRRAAEGLPPEPLYAQRHPDPPTPLLIECGDAGRAGSNPKSGGALIFELVGRRPLYEPLQWPTPHEYAPPSVERGSERLGITNTRMP